MSDQESDEALSSRAMLAIAAALAPHPLRIEDDGIRLQELDLRLTVDARRYNADVISVVAEALHPSWSNPAVTRMLGPCPEEHAFRHVAMQWATGVQPALCRLLNRGPPPELTMASWIKDEPARPVLWAAAQGPAIITEMGGADQGVSANGIAAEVIRDALSPLMAQALARRRLVSITCVIVQSDDRSDADAYFCGHPWPEAAHALRGVPLPPLPRDLPYRSQRMFLVYEPQDWSTVNVAHYTNAIQAAGPAPVEPRSRWQFWRR